MSTLPDGPDLGALKSKHGDLYELTACDRTVMVHAPSEEIFQRFRDDGSVDARKSTATKRLLEACVVWPDKPTFTAMIAKQPGLVESWGNKLVTIAGLTADCEVRKL